MIDRFEQFLEVGYDRVFSDGFIVMIMIWRNSDKNKWEPALLEVFEDVDEIQIAFETGAKTDDPDVFPFMRMTSLTDWGSNERNQRPS